MSNTIKRNYFWKFRLTPDPKREFDNTYSYVWNDPINYIDPNWKWLLNLVKRFLNKLCGHTLEELNTEATSTIVYRSNVTVISDTLENNQENNINYVGSDRSFGSFNSDNSSYNKMTNKHVQNLINNRPAICTWMIKNYKSCKYFLNHNLSQNK